MNARTTQSSAMIRKAIAAPENKLLVDRDITVMVIVVVLMILGLLLSSRSGGG